MMPIKGLFDRNENNDDEINKLTKRVKALELKTNTLDVHMKRFVKLENKWQSEAFSSTYNKNKQKESPREPEKKETLKREALSAIQQRLYLQLSEYFSRKLSPIRKEIDSLKDRISVMEKNFSVVKDLMEENLQQTNELKGEIQRMKINLTTEREEKPVVIRELKIDKILLDKYEQNNNFGCLGIKDISGQLNIGATYGNSAIPAGIAEELIGDLENLEKETENETVDAEDESSYELNSDSGNESNNESSNDGHGEGHSAYFENEQQRDDDTGGFTDVPIE
ncbi:hypothetical protein DCC39_00725 [Pueribacillus theae]|uniref:Uncharacterized protein n=1 Tax=Pueribacillus theae TaxID=2171751 RepID=A0A2U1K8H0_9BACI|nr:hypothetical protein [Pueribacillus theae]PWA13448.1 hypothetical protein DCC39_00725 [Pueribacillus theae]